MILAIGLMKIANRSHVICVHCRQQFEVDKLDVTILACTWCGTTLKVVSVEIIYQFSTTEIAPPGDGDPDDPTPIADLG